MVEGRTYKMEIIEAIEEYILITPELLTIIVMYLICAELNDHSLTTIYGLHVV